MIFVPKKSDHGRNRGRDGGEPLNGGGQHGMIAVTGSIGQREHSADHEGLQLAEERTRKQEEVARAQRRQPRAELRLLGGRQQGAIDRPGEKQGEADQRDQEGDAEMTYWQPSQRAGQIASIGIYQDRDCSQQEHQGEHQSGVGNETAHDDRHRGHEVASTAWNEVVGVISDVTHGTGVFDIRWRRLRSRNVGGATSGGRAEDEAALRFGHRRRQRRPHIAAA
jgi:hypothetical protein